MLTLKVISQETEKVLKGLEKKHFKNAKETIEKVLELDKERRAAQQELDTVLAQNKQLAAKIGQLMKAGAADEANAVKEEVAAPAPVAAEGKAILFSRVTCPNCRVAENLLNKAGIAYEKLIAEENVDLCREYGIKGAPTLVLTDGENHVNYYSVPEIKKYLASL